MVLGVVATALLIPAPSATANGCITPAAGTSVDPFLIQDVANLECLRANRADYWNRGFHFEQTADLDLSAAGAWINGIGDDTDPFNGTYDGGGFTIEALAVNGTSKVGLFAHTSGATLTNLTLLDPVITSTGDNAGALAGYIDDTTTIRNVHVSNGGGASVTSGGSRYGGLVGYATGGSTIVDSSSAAAVVAGGLVGFAGGLVGYAEDASISGSFATGDANSFAASGGLLGGAMGRTRIFQSYAAGDASDSLPAAGGLVGFVAIDDTDSITIDQSFATGDSTSYNGAAGGLVGMTMHTDVLGLQQLVVTDSFASGSATGRYAAGGVVGQADAAVGPSLTVTRAYAVGVVDATDVTADDSAGGLLGAEEFAGAATFSGSYWNLTDSGAAATAPYGTESTRSAMTSPALYANAGWSISDTAPAGTTWVSCAAYNSGFPVLQWYAAAQGWTCAPPPPPPVFPPSAPLEVTGVAGDGLVSVSWSAPAFSGSFPVSTYQVTSSPAGDSCLVSVTVCEVSGLSNGTAYTFTVRALNGAGWSPWSAASAEVTPAAPVTPSIVITGSREQVRGRPGIAVAGSSTLEMGAVLRPWLRFPRQTTYAGGSAQILVDDTGAFTWERRTGKRVHVYMAIDGLESNRIVIRPSAPLD